MKITRLTIYSADLERQLRFYREVLRLPLIGRGRNYGEFQVGRSKLRIVSRTNSTTYHIAFNIPAFEEREALNWLHERVPVLKDGDEELVLFSSWNATAIYFYDADKNIIELISRRNLNLEAEGPFGASHLLCISEVGLGVSDVAAAYEQVHLTSGIPKYDGNFDRFCAAGDEDGLLIIVDKDRKKWFPTDDPVFSSDFILEGDMHLEFNRGQIAIG